MAFSKWEELPRSGHDKIKIFTNTPFPLQIFYVWPFVGESPFDFARVPGMHGQVLESARVAPRIVFAVARVEDLAQWGSELYSFVNIDQ